MTTKDGFDSLVLIQWPCNPTGIVLMTMLEKFFWYFLYFGIDFCWSRMRLIVSPKFLNRFEAIDFFLSVSESVLPNLHRFLHWLKSMLCRFSSFQVSEVLELSSLLPSLLHSMQHKHWQEELQMLLANLTFEGRDSSYGCRWTPIDRCYVRIPSTR